MTLPVVKETPPLLPMDVEHGGVTRADDPGAKQQNQLNSQGRAGMLKPKLAFNVKMLKKSNAISRHVLSGTFIPMDKKNITR